jgi:hypothetical protein
MSPDPLVKNSLPVSDLPIIESAGGVPSEVSDGADVTGPFSIQGILDRTRAMKGLLRLKPFDTSTEQGRSRERYRRAALTTFTSGMGGSGEELRVVAVRGYTHCSSVNQYGNIS